MAARGFFVGTSVSTIHSSIIKAMGLIARKGIAKMSRNKDQGYNFRGIEAAMNEMSPILIECGITITPRYSEHVAHERESKSGGKLRFVTIKGSYKFEADDGSFVVGEAYGEGMDSSDKATAKAMSVAYRTALFQQFVVPTMAIDPESGLGVPTRQDELEDVVMAMVEKFDAGNSWGAYEEWCGITDNEEKLFVWGLLKPHSKLRAEMKRLSEEERKGDGAGA